MKITDFYDLIVYINLDSRPDRNEMAQKEFEKIGIEPIRIPGVVYKGTDNPHYNGIAGCTLSHVECLKMAIERKANILVFEDDVKFLPNTLEIVEAALNEIQQFSYDMLYWGGNICAPIQQVSDHLGKLSHSQSTHAYSVSANFAEKLLSYIPNQIYPLDLVYTQNAVKNHNCYITVPMVAVQQTSYSDIEGQVVDYETWMPDRFQKNLIPLVKR